MKRTIKVRRSCSTRCERFDDSILICLYRINGCISVLFNIQVSLCIAKSGFTTIKILNSSVLIVLLMYKSIVYVWVVAQQLQHIKTRS